MLVNRFVTLTTSAIALACFAIVVPGGDAAAQQKQKVSIKSLAENTKYTQQHLIEVGDAPNHQVRVYEIVRRYPANAPIINGMKVTEWWTRGLSDYSDNSGPGTTYGVFVMENGDKFF